MSSLTYTDIYTKFTRTRVVMLAKDPDYSGVAITSGSLTIDKRYKFTATGTSANFSNVGFTGTIAIGQAFYATATATPTTWGGASVYAGMSPADIIEEEIANCRLKFESIADFCDADFVEDSADEIGLAMKYYTMFLLYQRSQNEKQGESEYNSAIKILTEQWGQGVNDYLEGTKQQSPDNSALLTEKTADVTNIDYSTDDMEEWD